MLRITYRRMTSIVSVLGLVAAILLVGAAPAEAVVPTITSFTPTTGGIGTPVTITGTGFTGVFSVKFNGVSAGFTILTDTHLTATVPNGATTGLVSVTTASGTATSIAVFLVTSSGTNKVDCTSDPSALQPAIDAAKPGSTLTISGTCLGTFTVFSKDLTLKGGPATLDARGAGTTLFVASGTVDVVRLTITGGTGTDFCGASPGCPQGGGIIDFGTVNLKRSTVSGNGGSSAYAGGGILNGGTLNIIHSVVTGNSAQFGGGIIDRSTPCASRDRVYRERELGAQRWRHLQQPGWSGHPHRLSRARERGL